MDDTELQTIRSKRLAELQQHQQGGDQKTKEDEAKIREHEIKNSILAQVLDQTARARLSTIAAAKPDKAQMIENMLVNMARMGQVQSKLSEEDLKGLLEKVSEQTQRKTTVKFDRRRVDLDEDF